MSITKPKLPADLPENFTWDDVIAPNGTDIGKTEQHGYNYLNKQLNQTQSACNLLAEETDAELGNKANWLGGIIKGDSVKEWALSAKVDRTVAAEITCTDTPYAGYWALEVDVSAGGGWRKLTATNVMTGDQWYCIYNVSEWTKWIPQATATPPQEFALPLTAGYLENQPCRYFKNQFGEVQVYFKAVNQAGVNAGQQVIATLPVGFRPTSNMHSVCSASNFNNIFYVFWVTTDGDISVTVHTNIPADQYAGFAGTINFLAAQ